MKLEQELKQAHFGDQYLKAVLNVLVTAEVLGSKTNAVLKPFGISKEQFNVLRILRGQYPKPATVQLITERMISKSSNATRLVEKMRMKGLVERTQCAADRRKVDVVITQKGLDLLIEVDPLVRATSDSHRNLSEDEAYTLNKLLEKMRG
ncbi:MAG: MarR family winged helix-turn-helix transcriptional regulator [Rhodothermales bacterium]